MVSWADYRHGHQELYHLALQESVARLYARAFPGSITCQHGLYHRWGRHTKRGGLELRHCRREIDPVPLTCCAEEAEGPREGKGALPGCFAACVIIHEEHICTQFLDQHDGFAFSCAETEQLAGDVLVQLPDLAPRR